MPDVSITRGDGAGSRVWWSGPPSGLGAQGGKRDSGTSARDSFTRIPCTGSGFMYELYERLAEMDGSSVISTYLGSSSPHIMFRIARSFRKGGESVDTSIFPMGSMAKARAPRVDVMNTRVGRCPGHMERHTRRQGT